MPIMVAVMIVPCYQVEVMHGIACYPIDWVRPAKLLIDKGNHSCCDLEFCKIQDGMKTYVSCVEFGFDSVMR